MSKVAIPTDSAACAVLPDNNKIDPVEICKLLVGKWQKIQDRQMHFDQMIIRFRAIALTVFTSAATASITLVKGNIVDARYAIPLFSIPVCFWVVAFLIDYFYYYKLLMGAVRVGMAVEMELSRLGIISFDLNEVLSRSVRQNAANILVVSFYIFPPSIFFLCYAFVSSSWFVSSA